MTFATSLSAIALNSLTSLFSTFWTKEGRLYRHILLSAIECRLPACNHVDSIYKLACRLRIIGDIRAEKSVPVLFSNPDHSVKGRRFVSRNCHHRDIADTSIGNNDASSKIQLCLWLYHLRVSRSLQSDKRVFIRSLVQLHRELELVTDIMFAATNVCAVYPRFSGSFSRRGVHYSLF